MIVDVIDTRAPRIESQRIRIIPSEGSRVHAGHWRSIIGQGICIQKDGLRRRRLVAGEYRGHRNSCRVGLAKPETFIGNKEERVVWFERASEETTEVVVTFRCLWLSRLIREPVIRIQHVV